LVNVIPGPNTCDRRSSPDGGQVRSTVPSKKTVIENIDARTRDQLR